MTTAAPPYDGGQPTQPGDVVAAPSDMPAEEALEKAAESGVRAEVYAYHPSLDGLRAVLIATVIATHLKVPFFQGGGNTVLVFFALSGFLITSILLAERNKRGSFSIRRFYIRRALRLFPALALLLVGLGIFALVFLHGNEKRYTLQSLAPVAFYFSNWIRALSNPVTWPDRQFYLFHGWSLSVEEQFYLLWPLTLTFLIARGAGRRGILIAVGCLAAVSLALRLLLLHGSSSAASEWTRFHGTDMLADQLLFGCGLAVLLNWKAGEKPRVPRRLGVPLLVAALVILFGFSIAYTFLEQNVWAAQLYFTGGLTLAGLSSAVVVGALVLTPNGLVSRILSSPPMLYMGKRTYGIYLYHFPIIFGLQRHGPGIYRHLLDINVPPEWLWVPTTLIAVPATFLVAHLSYALVEAPALSLKRRF